ncbi:MAG: Hsp20/alpha crystallin family protein [Magnetococcales bacterium]|nr:Hsp20/alpha crystallin family protein [Magnetococcales bacterium]
MSITFYDPFRNVRALQNEINRLFERDVDGDSSMLASWPLRVDILETEEQVVIRADVPGMEQKDIKVNVDNGRLSISGERNFADEERREDYHRVERAYGRFSRTFQLPGTTHVEGIQAKYANGVLEVTLPKREEAKPRQIEVAVQ